MEDPAKKVEAVGKRTRFKLPWSVSKGGFDLNLSMQLFHSVSPLEF
jgi:hypothetical protein